jgi:predicted ATPase with chaperone activity
MSALAELAPESTEESAASSGSLAELINQIHQRLSDSEPPTESFVPPQPKSLEEAGVSAEEIEKIVCKLLASRGAMAGRKIAEHVGLPFGLMEGLLRQLKSDLMLGYKNTAAVSDYEYVLTDIGRERARRYAEECTYFGSAPVPLKDYVASVKAQSIAIQPVDQEKLRASFADLLVNQAMFDRLGPAINSGRGMFLYGFPGNGKTSIAERITRCFGSEIWVPRAISVDGEIVRVYDPVNHEEVKRSRNSLLLDGVEDRRWVCIRRPTIVAGGELTMAELEIRQNPVSKVSEAPLQLKSNCGTFVIDDFGRQRMPTTELLNRWIVPLEKRYDFLSLTNGKKIQVPFDQLLIFSTNLQPRDLVDEAFLRRIPYKIHVIDPTADEFRKLFELVAPRVGLPHNPHAVEYLIERHYQSAGRPMRACHPRDLLLQVRNLCLYQNMPLEVTPAAFDVAVENYFTVL